MENVNRRAFLIRATVGGVLVASRLEAEKLIAAVATTDKTGGVIIIDIQHEGCAGLDIVTGDKFLRYQIDGDGVRTTYRIAYNGKLTNYCVFDVKSSSYTIHSLTVEGDQSDDMAQKYRDLAEAGADQLERSIAERTAAMARIQQAPLVK